MQFRFVLPAMMIMVVSLMNGCVSTGTYQAKEQESMQLSKSLEESKAALGEMSDRNSKLATEIEALNGKLKKLDGEFAALKDESARLKEDNGKLKDETVRLKEENAKLAEAAKPENLLKALADSLATLQNENSKLKLALEDAEKSAKISSEPLKITPDIAKPAPSSKEETLKTEPADAGQKTPAPTPKTE